MTLEAAYLGAQSIGGTELNPAADLTFTTPITVTEEGWLVAVEAVMYGGTSNIGAAVYTDNNGKPGKLIGVYGHSNVTYGLGTTPRWVTLPVMMWLASGDYHLGVNSRGGLGAIKFREATGGSSGDGHYIDGISSRISDSEYSPVVATTSTYSIRGVFLTTADEPTVPDAPTEVIAYAQSHTSIIVEWDASYGATGHRVERSMDGSTGWTEVGDITEPPSVFGDSGLTPETTYYYRVIAYNAVGDSDPSDVVNATTEEDPNPPEPPTAPEGGLPIDLRGGEHRPTGMISKAIDLRRRT